MARKIKIGERYLVKLFDGKVVQVSNRAAAGTWSEQELYYTKEYGYEIHFYKDELIPLTRAGEVLYGG